MKTEGRTPKRQQLQLAIPVPQAAAARPNRPCTRQRADWWFRQMRRVVEEGLDYRAPGVF